MSTGGSLVVQDVLGGSSGKSFDATSVIEMQPLSIGAVPAAKTIVNYSTRTLKQPEETDPEKLNWEKEEVYGVPTTVQVENPFWAEGPAGIVTEARPQYFRYTYTPYTLIQRTYDTLDRLTTQVTTEYTIMAEVAPGYVQHICGRYFVGHSGPKKQLTPPQGSSVYTIITTETTTYKVAAPSIFAQDAELPTGYEEVDKAETIVSEPVLKLVGSTQIYTSAGDLNIEFDYGQSNGTRFISEKQIRRSEQSQGSQRQQVTKSTTERYLCQAYTQVGQQALAEAINKNAGDAAFFNNGAAIAMFVGAQSLKPLGTESQIASGREIGLQQRPPEGARTTNSTTVEASSESEVISGTGFGTQSFTLPYAPDDAFVKTGSTYTSVKSDAAKKARAYGTAQNKMRAGMRHGVNVKAAAYACGGPPGGSAAVSVGGVAVFGLAEGVSYTMDSNGVVVSVDVVPLGTAGSV